MRTNLTVWCCTEKNPTKTVEIIFKRLSRQKNSDIISSEWRTTPMYRLFVTEIDLCVIKVGILGIGKVPTSQKNIDK